ncbi:MAG: hypothetical protein E7411_08335 [Ruminococcaceae bacterium]|nr:hypothetical protein [Oscillospiraceae bacterium]
MEYVFYYAKVMLYPIAAIFLCGLAVWACSLLFIRLMGSGYKLTVWSAIIGTPVHELGHAGMCLLFGHKITKMVLWQPRSTDGTLGYVKHSYNPKNIYQLAGNLFIGIGPIFSGLLVLCLALFVAFPETWDFYVKTLSEISKAPLSIDGTIEFGKEILERIFNGLSGNLWTLFGQILALVLMASVSLHISLSPADIKNSLTAMPIYLAVTGAAGTLALIMGKKAMSHLTGALMSFNVFMITLFTIIFTFAALLIIIAASVKFIKYITTLIKNR